MPSLDLGRIMFTKYSAFNLILSTPALERDTVSASSRSSLLSTLFDNFRPLLMAGIASAFVAATAFVRLHQWWAALWFAADLGTTSARLGMVYLYTSRGPSARVHPQRWAISYVPLALASSLLLGTGTMACVMSADTEVAALAIMVTAGVLGGIASRNAALPYLAITQILLGALPIGLGALLTARSGFWILVPPLVAYVTAMVSVVRRHYEGLVALMSAEQKHAEIAARFDAALANMPHGLCTTDIAGRVIIANRRTAELFGATAEMLKLNAPLPEFIGHVALAQFGETLRPQITERCAAWLREGRSPLNLELRDGRQLEMTRNPLPDGTAVIIIEDVTERRQNEANILYLARHDSLTGLANHREFGDQLDTILAHATITHENAPAVMYLDLDGFKQVNDKLGHGAGDEVLKEVAARLKRALRHDELAARLGGDEFAIVGQYADLTSATATAQRLIRELERPYRLSAGKTVAIGTSIGIAFATGNEAPDQIIRRADDALYRAKQAGKGTYRVSRGAVMR